jgi:hypothetical protein
MKIKQKILYGRTSIILWGKMFSSSIRQVLLPNSAELCGPFKQVS